MSQKRIMVVDDEDEIRRLYASFFSKAGYDVTTAASAEEALEIIRQSPFWVYFLDLNLPKMDGVELCRQIRRDWPLAICYAVTGYASLFELADCREAGFEDYFTKPASLADLLNAANDAFLKLDRWKRK